MNKVTIEINSIFVSPELVAEHMKSFADLNVESHFFGTCNDNSKWILTGTVSDLNKVVYKYFLGHGFYSTQEVLDKETMKVLSLKADPLHDDSISIAEYELRKTAI